MPASHGDASRIDALVVQLLARIEEDDHSVDSVLNELCAAHPDDAEALRESVRALHDAGLLGVAQEDEPLPERLGEFRILDRLGSGGMGLVYLAQQESMERRVALKLIRPDQLYFPGARARFQREVRAVARLAHPHIVPVFAVGEQDGIPFLAMEYVEGVPLDRLLVGLAGRPHADLTARDARESVAAALGEARAERGGWDWDEDFWSGSWRALALRIAHAVAEALGHAHVRGVLHRDVKPSNVMVTPEGRVLLLDFGLASLSSEDRVTRTGAMLGSLPYMAPEQIEGGEEADARTDVYGLGVTLYELLTLRSPFHDPGSSERTRGRVLEGRPRAPRRIDPGLSRDVEAVCLVAMDRDRGRRYASISDLTADLDAVLAGRAVRARPAGTLTHLSRWARRQPFAATASAVALVALIGGPTGWAVQRSLAADRIQKQLTRADRHLERSRTALRLLGDVAMYGLADVPGASSERRKILEATRDFWAAVVAEEQGRGDIGVDQGLALFEIGQLQHHLDENPEAEGYLRRAVEIFEQHDPTLVAAGGKVADHLATTLNTLAQVVSDLGRSDEAQGFLARARDALENLDADAPEVRFGLAVADVREAMTRTRENDAETAIELLERAIPELEAQAEGSDRKDRYVYLAFAYGQQAFAASVTGETEDMLAWLDKSAAVYAAGLERWPESRDMRTQLFVTSYNLAYGLRASERYDEALVASERALSMAQSLADEFPGFPEMRANLASAWGGLGSVYYELGRHAEARDELQKAWDEYAALNRDHPANVPHLVQAATIAPALTATHIDLGDFEAGLEMAAEFARAREELVAVQPSYPGIPPLDEVAVLRCRSLIGLERVAQALDEGEHLVGTLPELGVVLARDLAGVLSDELTAELRERVCLRVLAHLNALADVGFDLGAAIESGAFDALDGRADYEALLARLVD